MKKYLSLFLVVLLLMTALVLTACGGGDKADLSDSKYVGTWKASDVGFAGQTGDLEDEITMTLKEDGTGTLEGSGETSEFTWKLVDGGFKASGDMKATFVDDGDNIKTKIFGAELVFERQ